MANSIPDQPQMLSPDDADELFIWSQANARTERVSRGTLVQGFSARENFIQLDDTPADYVGQNGNAVIVKATEDGLEFGSAPGGGATVFTDLTDTPANYTDAPDTITTENPNPKTIGVSAAEDGLELEWNISKTSGVGVRFNSTLPAPPGWTEIVYTSQNWGAAQFGDGPSTFWSGADGGLLNTPAVGYYICSANMIFRTAGGIATPFGLFIVEQFRTPTAVAQCAAGNMVESTSEVDHLISIQWMGSRSNGQGFRIWAYTNEAGIDLRCPTNGGAGITRLPYRVNGDYTSS
jgi:hypothetical protein